MNHCTPLRFATSQNPTSTAQTPANASQATATLAHDLPVFLVGMMGAGKTTVARSLARTLGRDCIDLDQELEAHCGVRIPIIFDIEGEAGFRRRESAALAVYTQHRNIVLATGGGVVLASANRRLLCERGIVVYLRASVDELFRRTRHSHNRPLLAVDDARSTLVTLLAEREPLYQAVADLTIDTGSMPVNNLVKIVLQQLQAFRKSL